jgi:Cu2+-exporting ATPase
MEARLGPHHYRLGRAAWALAAAAPDAPETQAANVVLARDGELLASFQFEDRLRADAAAAVSELDHNGFAVEVLSGDRRETVQRIARALGARHAANVSPAGKVARVAEIEAAGQHVLMVGDGLNDAPALAAAHASMAPASAADIGRNAADLVFLRESLLAVPQALAIARAAARLVRQNFAFAVAYNLVAIPIAVLGQVTPLMAAVAMSLSSLIVVGNALRLAGGTGLRRTARSDEPIAHMAGAAP